MSSGADAGSPIITGMQAAVLFDKLITLKHETGTFGDGDEFGPRNTPATQALTQSMKMHHDSWTTSPIVLANPVLAGYNLAGTIYKYSKEISVEQGTFINVFMQTLFETLSNGFFDEMEGQPRQDNELNEVMGLFYEAAGRRLANLSTE